MKRWVAGLTMLAMAALSGCGQAGGGSQATAAPDSEKMQTSAAANDVSQGSGEAVTINYYGRPDDNNVETTIVKAFEESHPDIKINYVELPDSSNDRLKTINTVLQAGDSSIDVFAGDVTWPPIFASAGWVVPLDDYIETEELDDYLPGPLNAFQLMGKTYGLPFMADAGTLYYRKDLLDKYGKEVPATWKELCETAQEIVEKEGDPELKGFASYWMQNESLTSSMLEIYWEKGARIIDDNGECVIDQGLLEETLSDMKNMIDSEITVDGIETLGTADARKVVCAGKAVFARDWLSGYGPYNNPESSEVAGNMEITTLPSYGCLGGWGVMVSAYSKHPAEAVEFARFRADYDSQMIALELVDIKPTIASAYTDEEVLAKKPELPKYLPALEQSRPRPKSPFYAEVSGVMQLEIHSVITGMSTPADSAAKIVQQVKQILQ